MVVNFISYVYQLRNNSQKPVRVLLGKGTILRTKAGTSNPHEWNYGYFCAIVNCLQDLICLNLGWK